jgi:hypothetical protein
MTNFLLRIKKAYRYTRIVILQLKNLNVGDKLFILSFLSEARALLSLNRKSFVNEHVGK